MLRGTLESGCGRIVRVGQVRPGLLAGLFVADCVVDGQIPDLLAAGNIPFLLHLPDFLEAALRLLVFDQQLHLLVSGRTITRKTVRPGAETRGPAALLPRFSTTRKATTRVCAQGGARTLRLLSALPRAIRKDKETNSSRE